MNKYDPKYKAVPGIIFIIVMMMAGACSHPATTKKNVPIKPANSKNYQQASIDTVIKITDKPQGDNLHDPCAFDDIKVYAKQDTNSEVIATIPALTSLNILSSQEFSGADTISNGVGKEPALRMWLMCFYKIKLPAGKTGYILPDHMAKYVYTDSTNNARYLMGDYYSKEKDWIFRVGKFELGSNKRLDYFEHKNFSEAMLEIFVIKTTPLKNISRIIKINAHADYCGGSESALMIADANGHLIALPEDYASLDDGGGVYTVNVYMPHKNKDGKVVLSIDTTGYQHNDETLTAYPAHLHIPINELLVQSTTKGQYFMDSDNNEVKLKNGKYKMETPLTTTTYYYHWDGKAINKLPGRQVVKL